MQLSNALLLLSSRSGQFNINGVLVDTLANSLTVNQFHFLLLRNRTNFILIQIRLSGSTQSGPLSTFNNMLDNSTKAKLAQVSNGNSIFLSATISTSEILLLCGLPGNMVISDSFGIFEVQSLLIA